MYTITLETNTKCNLKCTYCYLGDKSFKEMPISISKQAIDIAVHESMKQYDKTLFVCFLGGEPLLSVDFIRETIDYVSQKCSANGLKTLFGITTNGTLYNDDIDKLLSEHKFTIRVSLDGDKATQDLNRVDYHGNGSYNTVVSNLPHFDRICSDNNEILRVVQVITTNNAGMLCHNFDHFVDVLNVKYIESGPNNNDIWTNEHINTLKANLAKTISHYLKQIENKNGVYWNMYHQHLRHFLFPNKCFYTCMAGLSSIFVNVSGYIYFCRESDVSLQIGNVETGLNVPKIREIAYIRDSMNQDCIECPYNQYCSTKGCFAENYIVNSDIYKPVMISCEITKFFVEYFINNLSQDDIKRLRNNMKQLGKTGC